MRTPFARVSRRSLQWLLWLGLLLPLAQVAAAAHALSHTSQEASRNGDGTQAAQSHCDLCLIAAAIGGVAPPARPPVLTPVTASHAAAPLAAADLAPAVPALAYRSRAPPSASR